MKKLFPIVLAFLLLLPFSVDAQFGPLVPEVCKSCPCGFGGVLAIIQNAVNLLIALSIIFATIIIAWAGGLYMLSATNPESRSQANKMLLNAVVGICIVLSAWLIVDFVMKTLYGGQFGPWNSILSAGGGDSCIVARETGDFIDGDIVTVNPDTPTTPGVQSPIVGNEAEVRRQFAEAGIRINKDPCPEGTRYQDVAGGCTSVGGLRQSTVSQTINIKNICGSITVTGGSELGHADGGLSHGSGSKIDLSTGIDSCIQGGSDGFFARNGSRGSHPRYIDKCNNEYVRESTHWDITVTAVCSR